jgi:hypothetical protein
VLNRLFGAQGQRGLVFFSDAYLTDPYDPERAWCSMDGVRMDPGTGKPLETAKHDYLFAYGTHLAFHLQLELQDIGDGDLEALSLLGHLLQDFQRGDIPLGGEKTSGFGWVQAAITDLTWLTGDLGGISQKLFGQQTLTSDGIWQRLDLAGEAALAAAQFSQPIIRGETKSPAAPPKARAGFISHRSFGGHCGLLVVAAEVLTPLHIRESGEPSRRATLDGGPVNGWDFFSMSPPEADHRPAQKLYALPSRSLRGLFRHVYAIASDSHQAGADIAHLNPTEGLFGWVGQGPNQALAGRLSFGFAMFENPELGWFKVPYPYGNWQYTGSQWQHVTGGKAAQHLIAKTWRLFPHAPLAPLAKQVDDFQPDTAQASYFQALLPNARARFTIRFWNLEEPELQRLIWCVGLEPGLAHKLGNHRYLGFGSVRCHILPDSYLIDWTKRYAGQPEANWQVPLRSADWIKPAVVAHYQDLRKALNAERL